MTGKALRPASEADSRRARSGSRLSYPGRLLQLLMVAGALGLAGCASMISNVTEGLATDLSDAILNSEDLEVVRDGAPAYLIMLDALLRNDPDNPTLLIAAGRLNSAYATAFVDNPTRKQAFAGKAFELVKRAACIELSWTCSAEAMPFAEFQMQVDGLGAHAVASA